MFRVIYYLLPLGVALGVLTIDEFYQRRHAVVPVGQRLRHPDDGGGAEAAGGLHDARRRGADVLRRYADGGRAVAWVNAFVPLPVIELSHFVGSVVGFGLLVVAWGLARRLDAAYVLGCIGLVVGIVASLLKGGDYEEALVLSALLVALFVSREEFDRKAALFEMPFSPTWVVSTLVVVAGSIGLGLFAFRHVEWSQELWWRFEVDQDAPRFLRATVGILIAMTFVGVRRLMRPAQPDVQAPGRPELDEAAPIVVAQRAHDSEPRVPRRQGTAVERRAHGVRDVRRPGTHVGGARRSRGPAGRRRAAREGASSSAATTTRACRSSTRRRSSGSTSTRTSA